MSKPKTPRHNPKAKPGSLQRIVRHPKVHHSKFSCPRLCKNTAATVRSLCRECNRKTGKRKSASIRVIRGQNPGGHFTSPHGPVPGVCSPPNAKLTDDEERAKRIRIGTLGWPRSSSFGPASCYPVGFFHVSLS